MGNARKKNWGGILPVFLLSLSGCGTQSPPALPHLSVLTARVTKGHEHLWLTGFSAQGKPQTAALDLGRLGLVAQTQIAAASPYGLWISLGDTVVKVRHQAIVGRIVAPRGTTVLSLRWISRQLWVVAENIQANAIWVFARRNHRWIKVTGLPVGITTLARGFRGSPYAFTVGPTWARVTGLKSLQRFPMVRRMMPQGTIAFSKPHAALIPFSTGTRGFGAARVFPAGLRSVHYASVWRAAIEVTDTHPMWGLTPKGMVPYRRHGSFYWNKLKPWPTPLQATAVVVGRGRPWVLVLGGPSQGFWFNVETGRYGPQFKINNGPTAFARQVVITR